MCQLKTSMNGEVDHLKHDRQVLVMCFMTLLCLILLCFILARTSKSGKIDFVGSNARPTEPRPLFLASFLYHRDDIMDVLGELRAHGMHCVRKHLPPACYRVMPADCLLRLGWMGQRCHSGAGENRSRNID